MDEALGEAGAALVTGDTKVVERGSLDGIVINTAGIGVAERVVRDSALVPGDRIIVTGTLGDHGLAILAHREGFNLGEQLRLGRGAGLAAGRARARGRARFTR